MNQGIVIFGAGGHAKVIVDIIEKSGSYHILGFIDCYKSAGTDVYGYKVLGDDAFINDHQDTILGGIVAIGDNWKRYLIVTEIIDLNPNFNFITAVHPSASIAKGVVIGNGTAVMAGAIINSDTIIGSHCIINTKSSVDHDCIVRDFVTIAPSATSGAGTMIGEFVALSLSASVIHGKSIGSHTIVGAGSTVLSDLDSYVVAYGTPAKPVRSRVKGEKYL